MNRKIIVLTIIGMFLSTTLISTIAAAQFESDIVVESEEEYKDPLEAKSHEAKIIVKYKLNVSDLTHWFITKRRIGRMAAFGLPYIFKLVQLPAAEVNVTLSDTPDWCQAEIVEDSLLNFDFTQKGFQEQTLTVKFSFNESAPGLKLGEIDVKANFSYAGNGSLLDASNTYTLSFRPEFVSGFEVNITETMEITPKKETIIPINITNMGNGETIFKIEVDDPLEKWNVSFNPAEITIKNDEDENTKTVNLVVKSPKSFKSEMLNFTITPKSVAVDNVDEQFLEGTAKSFSITLKNDGSLDDDGIFVIDTTMLIVVLVVIVLVLVGLFILKRKKQ